MSAHNWIDLAQDADTGIETLRAHFEGHAYDPHWHDSYLVGVTEQGVQQFNCRRARHQSTPGKVFLLEPGDIHDGEAPTADGFTPDQQFFIAYARMWGENVRPEQARLWAAANPHPPGNHRVNGTLANVSQFARAFGAPAGAADAKRCVIW